MSDSVWPHRQQPTRLPRPWDSPGKNTGVGCYFLPQCMKVKSEREVAQSCPTLCNPMDCRLPGSSTHGIFQARVLEWGAIAFSGGIPYFLQLKSESGNKEFMIWATVSYQSSLCWLYRASSSLAAKNIINLILVLAIWWCPCVESSLGLLEEVFAMTSEFSWQNSISLCPASFCTLKATFAYYSRYFLTSYLCIPVPYNEKDIFLRC